MTNIVAVVRLKPRFSASEGETYIAEALAAKNGVEVILSCIATNGEHATSSGAAPSPVPEPSDTHACTVAGLDLSVPEASWIAAIREMGNTVYAINEANGFHEKPRSTLERAMLVVTELSELSESARNGTLAEPSDHIREFTQAEEEWADVLVRLLDHSIDDGVQPVRLALAFIAKIRYNRTRGYRHGGKTI